MLIFTAIVVGCTRDLPDAGGDEPWTVVADSSGDTIRIRIDGAIPARLVRALVPELRVGAADGAEEETFGSVDYVFGTADDGLLIYDGQAKAARLFDGGGRFVRRVGATGEGPGEHGHLNGITRLPDGDWVFWDAPGGRLNRYTYAGDFRGTVRLPIHGWFLQDGLRSDTASLLYAWSVLSRNAQTGEFESEGLIQLDTLGGVRDTVVYPLWGPEPAVLTAQSADGGSSRVQGVPWSGGSASALTQAGGLVSGFGTEYVFYLLPSAGRPVRVERAHQRVAVSSTEASERRAQITQRMRQVNPAWTWTGPALPTVKPAYRSLKVGEDGRVWVQLSTVGENIPADELADVPTTPDPPVQLSTLEPDLYDVYSPDGRLLGRVAPPPRTRLLRFAGTYVWGVQQDSLDVSYAVRFRIFPAFEPEERP